MILRYASTIGARSPGSGGAGAAAVGAAADDRAAPGVAVVAGLSGAFCPHATANASTSVPVDSDAATEGFRIVWRPSILRDYRTAAIPVMTSQLNRTKR